MSRAYRITVNETLHREIVAGDAVRSRLDLLPILPAEQTAALLKAELLAKGFVEQADATLVRKNEDITVSVDPCNGEVTVSIAKTSETTLETDRTVIAWDDVGAGLEAAEAKLRAELQSELEKKAARKNEELQKQTTAKLEAKLAELQPELANVVNKVTREALKAKARQLGNVIEAHEDEASGSLTLKVEV